MKSLDIAALQQMIAGRQVWIWGAGNHGRGLSQSLDKYGIKVNGFIDKSSDLLGKRALGLPIVGPSMIEMNGFSEQHFIIVSTFYFEAEVKQTCQASGLEEDCDFIAYTRLKPNDYAIDITGACNLKCISCPHAYNNPAERKGGVMHLDLFKQVLDKIVAEAPFVGNVQLYQWGEPTLHKQLPQMLNYAETLGIKCAVSSNLNVPADFESIIKAKPEWLRLSASGWEKRYEITHTLGDWELFTHNLREVCRLRKRWHPEMKVELYYHLYKHSVGEDFDRWKALCSELEIEFHPVYAYLISLDDVLAYQEGAPLPVEAQKASEMLLYPMDEGVREAKAEAKLPCDTFRCISINWDLSVSNCMMYYYPTNNVAAANYLETPIDEIMSVREDCNLCQRCMDKGVHRYCGVYSRKKVDQKMMQGGD